MIWPFKRKRTARLEAHNAFSDPPNEVKIYGAHDTVVDSFLSMAYKRAQELPVDVAFMIELPEVWRGNSHPMMMVGPVMMRAHEYNLTPGSCTNWNFEFTWNGEPIANHGIDGS